ncbi:glycosyl hydrolases family 18-domain-containing protein [Mortierella sp. GBAus27b]|nr:glycosyl hydrolases family 18-domain-containing protein [Mortierella sp. GBAus27b]
MKFHLFTLTATVIAVASVVAVPVKRATDDKVVVGYWVPWSDVPVAALDMTKYTHINYAFGMMTKATAKPTDIKFNHTSDGANVKALVQRGNQYGVPVLISIGGWTGSQTFSPAVATADSRKTFIENAMLFVRNNTRPDGQTPNGYNMDGIDVDWEYPGRQGAECNIYNSQDSANYLQFLKELRAQLDLEFPSKHKYITAAVRVQPFDDASGKPMKDVSAFVPYFDWVSVMIYDITGAWSAATGPNAPFNTPSSPGEPFSFNQAVNSWKSAGWPLNKLVAGMPFYGRAVTSTIDMNAVNPPSIHAPQTGVVPKGGPSDTNTPDENCSEGAVYSGFWSWKEIRTNILTSNPTTPVSGWVRHWDNKTQTPWLFRSSDKMFISYDDIESLSIKVNYVKQNGLRGSMFWEMSYDYNSELVNVLNSARSPTTPTTTISTSSVPSTSSSSSSSVPTFTTTPTTTTTTTMSTTCDTSPPSSPTPTPPLYCNQFPTWNAATVYATAGTKVTYNGRIYSNKWWTQGETPGTSWGAWKDEVYCAVIAPA